MRRPRPERAYLVCATPRSGSTLLCELLRATGIAGRPLEHFEVMRHSGVPRRPREYFEGVHDPRILGHLPPLPPPATMTAEAPETWWARVLREGSTANGVWGAKVMWGHVDDLVARARALAGLDGADLAAVLRALLGDVAFVHVTRGDTVAQAVSLWRAVQTDAWRAGGDGGTEAADYVFEGIDHLRHMLDDHDAAWRDWFAEHGLTALEVDYDALSADPRGVTAGVLRGLGLPGAEIPAPDVRRQRDERSEAWAERYRAERGARA